MPAEAARALVAAGDQDGTDGVEELVALFGSFDLSAQGRDQSEPSVRHMDFVSSSCDRAGMTYLVACPDDLPETTIKRVQQLADSHVGPEPDIWVGLGDGRVKRVDDLTPQELDFVLRNPSDGPEASEHDVREYRSHVEWRASHRDGR